MKHFYIYLSLLVLIVYNPTVKAAERTTTESSQVMDVDGNSYETLTLGKQVWMSENLKVTHYPDGSDIPFIDDRILWGNLGDNNSDDAYCFFNNNANGEKDLYGALYTYAAAVKGSPFDGGDPVQGVCPAGWHVPSMSEWDTLFIYLADNAYNYDGSVGGEGAKIAKSLASDSLWRLDTRVGSIGNTDFTSYRNKSGFNALPSGYRIQSTGSFYSLGKENFWWSSTQGSGISGYAMSMYYGYTYIDKRENNKSVGYSIRCVRDSLYALLVPTVITLDSLSLTGTTATLGGAIIDDGGGNISACGIEYSTLQNFISGSGTKVLSATLDVDSFYVTLDNLTKETNYYYKAFATHTEGTSYGDEHSMTTLAYELLSLSDIDNNEYSAVTIGQQTWMTENLKVKHYPDGTAIPLRVYENDNMVNKSNHDSYYIYDEDERNVDTYGLLYTHSAATAMSGAHNSSNQHQHQGVCPDGWHLPSTAEWQQLESFVEQEVAHYAVGSALKSLSGWENNRNGVDTYGFSALPGGYYAEYDNTYKYKGSGSYFWHSTMKNYDNAYVSEPSSYYGNLEKLVIEKVYGLSVRCVRDNEPNVMRPAVESHQADSVDSDALVLKGKVLSSGDAVVLSRGIEYSTVPNFVRGQGHQIDAESVDTGVFVVFIGMLSPTTTYYYRAYAYNSGGISYGDELSVTTLSHKQSVTDIDGNIYKAVTIGNQIWMAENLRVTKFPNGEHLSYISGNFEEAEFTFSTIDIKDRVNWYYAYDDDTSKVQTLGCLYSYGAASGYNWERDNVGEHPYQGICPNGWHLPSMEEWQVLIGELGVPDNLDDYLTIDTDEPDVYAKLAGYPAMWNGTITTNPNFGTSGFNAVPGGRTYRRTHEQKTMDHDDGSWWSRTGRSADPTVSMMVLNISPDELYSGLWYDYKTSARSVRCIKDDVDAEFSFSPMIAAPGKEIQFVDQSGIIDTGDMTWSWDFNNDGIEDSHLPNPNFTFNTTGHHKVTLTVSNGVEQRSRSRFVSAYTLGGDSCLAYIPFSGTELEGQGIACWNTNNGAQAEEVIHGHLLPQPPASIDTAYYFMASRDYVNSDAAAAMTGNEVAKHWPNLAHALSVNGKTFSDLSIVFGLTSLGDDIEGEDWDLINDYEWRKYNGGSFYIKCDDEDMIMGAMPELRLDIKYKAYLGRTDEISGVTGEAIPLNVSSASSEMTKSIAQAFMQDCASSPIQFIFASIQAALQMEFDEAGRFGGYFDVVQGYVIKSCHCTMAASASDQWTKSQEDVALSVAITNGTAPYTYAWSPAKYLDDATALSPMANWGNSTYYITVTDANGCQSDDSLMVHVDEYGSIDGYIRDRVTQEIIANGNVNLKGLSSKESTSNAEGYYLFEDLIPDSTYSIIASSDHYMSDSITHQDIQSNVCTRSNLLLTSIVTQNSTVDEDPDFSVYYDGNSFVVESLVASLRRVFIFDELGRMIVDSKVNGEQKWTSSTMKNTGFYMLRIETSVGVRSCIRFIRE